MHFFAAFKIIPQDIVKLTSSEKMREKQMILIQRTSLKTLSINTSSTFSARQYLTTLLTLAPKRAVHESI